MRMIVCTNFQTNGSSEQWTPTSSMLFSKNSVLSVTLLNRNFYVIAYSLSFILEHICKLYNNRQKHALPVYFRPVFVANNTQATYFFYFWVICSKPLALLVT